MSSLEDHSHLPKTGDFVESLTGLRSSKSSRRLEEIANLRARGIGEHVSLPQLVVCGDQSAGKSSVLEGITGLPFPRQDGVCTRFATEIMLVHTDGTTNILAEIIPASDRLEDVRTKLLAYKREMSDFIDLPHVITEVGTLMGIRGFGNLDVGPAFTQDVLRVKVSGPTGLHLSVVDLPGLISVANEEQTEADVKTVHDLVDSYVQNSRTIILAVVQANNDIANQGIIQKSKKFDRRGERTIGVITKPDLLNAGTESRIAALAKNQDTTKLKLGFHLLKNPAPSDIAAGISLQDREKLERDFFASPPWKEQALDPARVGITSLRNFLQLLLDQHIEKELPQVREEIILLLKRTGESLTDLGDARPTPAHLRMFLSRIAMRFHNIATAALHGDYHGVDAAFFDDSSDSAGHLRLRALVHNENTDFANEMREHGQTMKVRQVTQLDIELEVEPDESVDESVGEQDRQIFVSPAEMREFVLKLYRKTRGRELPGNYNHVLLTELFHYQSKWWRTIAQDHVAEVYSKVKLFVEDAVDYISVDEHVSAEMLERITTSLLESRDKADVELERLCDDKAQQPITYNHYYTDNIGNARRDVARKWVKKAMSDASIETYNGKLHISNTTADAEKLLIALQHQVSVNMDDQACSEVLAGFSAYYKVARKTFVDNVCIQVIERHILRTLPNFFSPEAVASYTDEELQRIAGESEVKIVKRKELETLHESLVAALQDLRR